jgi:hypothetical protein
MEWVRGSISKLLTEVVAKALAAHLHLNEEDRLFLVYGEKEPAVSVQIIIPRRKLY